MSYQEEDLKLDFVGIGAPKAATTWIYECLQEHPQLKLAPKDREQNTFFFKKEVTPSAIKEIKSAGEEDARLGEFHVSYLKKAEEVIPRMKQHNSDLKIIACLRDPVKRAYSQFRHTKFIRKNNWDSLQEAVEQEPGEIIEPGLYHKYLSKYYENFPAENILVLLFERIQEDPVKFIQRIYNFLEVDNSFKTSKMKTKINPSKVKLTELGSFVHEKITPFLSKSRLGRAIKNSNFLKNGYYRVVQLLSSDETERETEAQSMKEELRSYYRKDINKLEDLINKDLSSWK